MKNFQTKTTHIFVVIGASLALYVSLFFLIIPYLHNRTLNDFSNLLFAIQPPDDTKNLDLISKVAQQIGGGDHCDYLAAIKINSSLPKKDLETYYRAAYKGKSEVRFIWLNEQNSYTTDVFDDLSIYTLKNWVEESKDEEYVAVIYIFESAMTSAFDYRCS